MASLMLAMASSFVVPWLTQPGRLGHSATDQPSSPGRSTTCRRGGSTEASLPGDWGETVSPPGGAACAPGADPRS